MDVFGALELFPLNHNIIQYLYKQLSRTPLSGRLADIEANTDDSWDTEIGLL